HRAASGRSRKRAPAGRKAASAASTPAGRRASSLPGATPSCGRRRRCANPAKRRRSEEHTSELQSPCNLVCRLLLEKKNTTNKIGQELKVGSLIEGSVRKSKNQVRITVQLVDTESEEQLWTETYNRNLQDIFSVQSDIAQQVASALELRLGVRENSALLQQQTQNPEAYSLYLKGRNRWNLRSENEVNRAIKYFEEAIGKDPGYALAYAGLADCYSILGYYGYRRASVVS